MAAPDTVVQVKNHRYQRIIGLVTLLHGPFLLLFGLVFGVAMQPSYSDYFFTCIWFVFAAMLAIPGLSLIFYEGYPNDAGDIFSDKFITTICGISGICIVLFPTFTSDPSSCFGYQYYAALFPESARKFVGIVHFLAAAVFFGIFVYLFLNRFRRSNTDMTHEKALRNTVYFYAAGVIIFSMIAITVYAFGLRKHLPADLPFIFAFEFIAGVAIAAGLITKSEWIFPDKNGG